MWIGIDVLLRDYVFYFAYMHPVNRKNPMNLWENSEELSEVNGKIRDNGC
jgi:hypothetical protein